MLQSVDTLCWLCLRYGCHISASSTPHPAVCGEKYFVSWSPTPSALHRSLLFHHRKSHAAMASEDPGVGRWKVFICPRWSYLFQSNCQSESVRESKQLNRAGIGSWMLESTGAGAAHLCDLFLWGNRTSSVLNGVISSVLCCVLREMKIQIRDVLRHGLTGKGPHLDGGGRYLELVHFAAWFQSSCFLLHSLLFPDDSTETCDKETLGIITRICCTEKYTGCIQTESEI